MSSSNSKTVAERNPYLPTAAGTLEAIIIGAATVGYAVQRAALPALRWAVQHFPMLGWPIVGAFRVGMAALPQWADATGKATKSAGCLGFLLVTGGPLVALAAIGSLAWVFLGPIGMAVITAGAVVGLGWYGRPHNDGQAIEAPQTGIRQELAELLADKLGKSSLGADKFAVSDLRPVFAEDAGKVGRQVTIGLPAVVIADDVANLRPWIAGVFDSPRDRVKITEGSTPNQAIVFVADRSPSALPPARWPLVDANSFDLTKPIPIGQTPDGNPAHLQLFDRDNRGDLQGYHLLLTGMSRYGKSSLLQLILTAAGMDQRAVLDVTVLGQDTRDFEDIAPALSHLTVDATVEDLNAQLDRGLAHMAAKTRAPYLLVIDEAQFQLGEKGDSEARRKVRDLLSSGSKAGLSLIIVTQEPTKDNLHPDLARRPQNRISFRQSQNETAQRAMGSGMTDDTNPSLFRAGDKGLAAVIGEDGFHGRVKTPLLDAKLVARIAQDHRREAPEPVEFPTYSLDHDDQVQDPEPEPETVLDHLAAIWPTTEAGSGIPAPNVFIDHLLTLLQGWPTTAKAYDGWGRPELRKAAADRGLIAKEKVRIGDRTSPGFTRADLESARGGSAATRTARTP